MKTVLYLPLFLLALIVPAKAETVTINLTGNIDGRSDILISPSGFQWEHFQAEAPGRQDGGFPTLITVTNNGSPLLNSTWFPDWTPPTVLPPGSAPIFSSLLSTTVAETQLYVPDSIVFTALQARGGMSLAETPSAGNGYMFRVSFNDIFIPGSANYQFSLSYSVVPEPGVFGVVTGILGLAGAVWKRNQK